MSEASEEGNAVRILLSSDEALVLFDWLSRTSDSEELSFAHAAEQKVLWDMECDLETVLVEPFRPNYLEILAAARERVVQPIDKPAGATRNLLPDDYLPDWFKYPPEFLAVVERNLIDLRPWRILTDSLLHERLEGLKQRFPSRELVPFAQRLDNDDVACWDRADPGAVVVVHDFASPGFEKAGRSESFWAWFRNAVETMIEHEG